MELAFERRGSGPAVLVIEQLDPAAFWERSKALLARDHEVVAVTLPGFGDSPPLPSDQRPTPPALAAAVAGWMATAGLDAPLVVGSSLGGAVAIELARLGAVSGAVAISPVGFWTRREAALALGPLRLGHSVARAVDRRPGVLTRTGVGRTLAFGQLVARPRRMPEPVAREALHNMVSSPGFERTRRTVRDYRVEGPEPEVPVTIAWAAEDKMTRPHQADRVADVLPSATVIRLEGCGHAAMVDDPQAVARVVREAHAQLGSAARP